jgi:XRE family aerobic/anaerobic benzoate catabolism transcriptional regulator
MSDTLISLGLSIRSLREQEGLSVQQLAKRSRLSTRFITELQAGRANISVLRLMRVAAALGKTASALLAEAEKAHRAPHGKRPLIALLGIRGAGKSTVGERLATRLGLQFFELDRLVEAEAGLSLPEIFALHGEEYYRRLEVEALRRLLRGASGGVLATGGGIVTNLEAWQLLEEHTITVWLKASVQEHWHRVVHQGDPRPMAGRPAAKAELRRLMSEREPLYKRARYRVDTARLGVDGSVEAVVGKIGLQKGARAL